MKRAMALLATSAFATFASPVAAQTYEETCANAISQTDSAQTALTKLEAFQKDGDYPQISQQTANLLVSGSKGMKILTEQQKQDIASASKEEILPAMEQAFKDTINGNILLEVLFCAKPREHKP